LKLSEKQSVGLAPLHNIDYLQEFQYGDDISQTTTNNKYQKACGAVNST
jgi:hypothetical protein